MKLTPNQIKVSSKPEGRWVPLNPRSKVDSVIEQLTQKYSPKLKVHSYEGDPHDTGETPEKGYYLKWETEHSYDTPPIPAEDIPGSQEWGWQWENGEDHIGPIDSTQPATTGWCLWVPTHRWKATQ
jgi:hypothetical protein